MKTQGNKKKVVIFSTFYEPFMSGAERMVREICEKLGERYEITLVTARLDSSLPRLEKRPAFLISRVGIGHKKIDKFLYIFLAVWQARKYSPQIIHAIMESYAGGALVLAKYFCPRAKRILTLQSGDLDDERKQSKLHISYFWKLIHHTAHIVTAISSFLAKRAEVLGVSQARIFITPNGIDFDEIVNNPEKKKNEVLCMGRLSWEKGYDYLIPAWRKVVEKCPEASLQIWGEGPKKAEVESLIEKYNVSDSVNINGVIDHTEFMKKMSEAEIFVLPSLAEGLGNVFIEAQASGTVPIGTRVGGIPDVIQNEENGLLVEVKNSTAISQAILRLLEDSVLRCKLRNKGLETSRRFDWKLTLKRIDEIYEYALYEKGK